MTSSSESDVDLLRLAIEAHERFIAEHGRRSASDFLAENEELRELLEPLLGHGQLAPPPHKTSERVLGDFRLLGEIGRGAMGVVYEAEQISLGRRVAVKVLPSRLALAPGVRARFIRESRLAGRLDHPGIAKVIGAGADDDVFWFAMEFVDGAAFLDHVSQHKLDTKEILRLAVDLCSAVEHAHHRGVVHRDLKSANVLITLSGRVVVLDFGIAKVEDKNAPNLTGTGDCLGTPSAMSPQQAKGEPADERSDVWSLGVLLHQAFTGTHPLDLQGETSTALRTLANCIEIPPCAARQRLPGGLCRVLERALQPELRHRTPRVRELREDLERVSNGEDPRARPRSPMGRLTVRFRRHPLRNLLLSGVGLAVLGSAAVLLHASWQNRRLDVSQTQLVDTTGRLDVTRTLLLTALKWFDPEKGFKVSEGNRATWQDLRSDVMLFLGKVRDEPETRSTFLVLCAKIDWEMGDFTAAILDLDGASEAFEERGLRSAAEGLQARLLRAKVERDRSNFAGSEAQLLELATAPSFADLPPSDRAEIQMLALEVALDRQDLDQSLDPIEAELRELSFEFVADPQARGYYEVRQQLALANLFRMQYRDEESIAVLERLFLHCEPQISDGDWRYVLVKTELAAAFDHVKQYQKSAELMQNAWEFYREKFGPDHFRALELASMVEARKGTAEQRIEPLSDLLQRQIELFGNDVIFSLNTRMYLADSLLGASQAAKRASDPRADDLGKRSLDHARQAVRSYQELRGSRHPQTLSAMRLYAGALEGQGHLDEALAMRREIHIAQQATAGPGAPETIQALGRVAKIFDRLGRKQECRDCLLQGLRNLAVADRFDDPNAEWFRESLERNRYDPPVLEWFYAAGALPNRAESPWTAGITVTNWTDCWTHFKAEWDLGCKRDAPLHVRELRDAENAFHMGACLVRLQRFEEAWCMLQCSRLHLDAATEYWTGSRRSAREAAETEEVALARIQTLLGSWTLESIQCAAFLGDLELARAMVAESRAENEPSPDPLVRDRLERWNRYCFGAVDEPATSHR